MALGMQVTTLHEPEIVLPNGRLAALVLATMPFSLNLGSPVCLAPIQPHRPVDRVSRRGLARTDVIKAN